MFTEIPMRALYFFFLFFCCTSTLLSNQETRFISKTPQDSLGKKTLSELATMFWRGNDLDSTSKVMIRDAYILKAKKKQDPWRIADGYQMFMYMYTGHFETLLKYSDSIIDITKDLKNSHYPTTGYIFKGNALRSLEKYDEALTIFLKAKEIAEANSRSEQVNTVEYKIAELKTILGKDSEAFETYKKLYKLLLKRDSQKKNDQFYLGTVYKMAESYNKAQNYDSAYFFINDGIKNCLTNYYRHYYPELLFTSGVNSYHREKYNGAIDSLQKALILLNNNANDIMVRMSYLYLGKSYLKLKNDTKALTYLKKVASITTASNYGLEIREAFELLKNYYHKNDDKSKLIDLLSKWISYEKVSQEKYKKLDREIVEKYDFPNLIEEKEDLLNRTILDNESSKVKLILLCILVITLISFVFLFRYKKKKKEFQGMLEQHLNVLKKLNEDKSQAIVPKIELPNEIKQEILNKLNKFEEDLGFLKNNITLVRVSKILNTNSTYLSRTINEEKEKNFANYINDLRITYCIERIANDKKFRQYSIASMAGEVGFNNIQSFAKAFSKNMGENPAEYIRTNFCD